MGWKDPEYRRAYFRAYYIKNEEKKKLYHNEWYQKNKLESFAKIDPAMKCANCGCDDTRLLEINHINGGGRKEQRSLKKNYPKVSTNFVLLIQRGKRGTEGLNLLCRVCNSIDHLERVHGKTGLSVVWDKEKMK